MKVVVLVKQVPDTYEKRDIALDTGLLARQNSENIIDEIDERVSAVAAELKKAGTATEVVAVTMGPADADKSIRKVLALAADRAVHVVDDELAGSDMVQTARVLAEAAKDADLILSGAESTDGRGAMVPAMIAEMLGRPHIPGADSIEIADGTVTGVTNTDTERLTLSAATPAVVSLTEKAGEPKLTNFKAIREARKKEIAVTSLADLGLAAGPDAAYVRSVMVTAAERPPKEAGQKVSGDTAATELVDFLAARHLV
ncbi:electron transfer flavoprotein subunit beta/FixA family protein [Yaniella flava]|uniref:Electron transfer flavoprotein subunit beta n=1 Tax=Yaniella flava TaxID=287930 RepID=A0ABN2U3J1_9MICC